MKNLVVLGLVGLAGAGALYIYQSSGDASSPAAITQSAPENTVSAADMKAQLTAPIEIRQVQADEAQMAMEKFGLWVSEGETDWASRSGENGNYMFTDFNFEIDGATYAAAEMEISGVHLADNEHPYFDTLQMSDVTLFTDNDDRTGSVGTVIIKMPTNEAMQPAFKDMSAGDISTPLDYLELTMTQEFDAAIPFPEIIVENFKTTEKDSIRDGLDPRWSVAGETPESRPEPVFTTVENTTEIGFVGLTSMDGTDRFTIQANNFRSIDHGYKGKPETTSFTTANLTGFKADAQPEKMAMRMWSQMVMPTMDGSFDPAFQSMSIMGFEHNTELDQVRVDNAGLWFSDTQGDQYSLTADVPRIDVIARPLPQGVKRWESGNPLREIGYETGTLSMSSRTNFDKSNGMVELEYGKISMVDGFDLSGGYRVENWGGLMSGAFFGMPDPAQETGYEDAKPGINSARMVFTDRGIMDKVFTKQAEDQNMTLEEVKTMAKSGLVFGSAMGQSEYQQELIMSASNAVSALIDSGGTFTFNMQPQRTITLDELEGADPFGGPRHRRMDDDSASDDYAEDLKKQKMDDLLRLMNITFTHTP